MISFTISLLALVIGYMIYGRFVERVFGPDDRLTSAIRTAGVSLSSGPKTRSTNLPYEWQMVLTM